MSARVAADSRYCCFRRNSLPLKNCNTTNQGIIYPSHRGGERSPPKTYLTPSNAGPPLWVLRVFGCIPPVVSETTFATFLPTPRHECGGTSPNMRDAAIYDSAGQASSFFGHIARADSRLDHTRVLRSIISGLPRDWKRPPGRPRRTWLRTIEQDLRPLNIGLVSAWQRAQDRERWKRTVETAIRSS